MISSSVENIWAREQIIEHENMVSKWYLDEAEKNDKMMKQFVKRQFSIH
jgi:hypothetical protein